MRQLNGIAFAIFLSLICNLAIGTVIANDQEEGPIVHLENGAVQGLVATVIDKLKVNFFQGIRFGQAERFHKPTSEGSWSGIYDATKKQASCPQVVFFSNITTGISEDCLFLNVWAPETAEPTSNKSVMVWIYGGGFQGGSIFLDSYDARYISVLYNVIVVSVNYRLGPLGFASFGTKETPGNLGLYDQILGLKWVQENIRQFGGNPDDVTIFGESAGSISVGSLVLSPLTTGLFQRAILQSGAPNSRLVEKRATSLNRTVRFAQRLGCQGNELKTALKCLQNKTMEELVNSTVIDLINLDPFVPLYGDNELLPEDPIVTLKNFDRKIDLMFGVVRNEGSMFISLFIPNMDMENITQESAINGIKHMLLRINAPAKEAQAILQHYTRNFTKESSKNDLRNAVSDVVGDYYLVCPTILFGEQVARRMIQKNHTSINDNNHFYAYRMTTSLKHPTQDDWMGVNHADELPYLFGLPMEMYQRNHSSIDVKDVQLSYLMMATWTRFASAGQMVNLPGVKWDEAIDPHHPEQSSASYFSLREWEMVNDYWKVTCDQLWKPVLEGHL